MTPVRQEFQCSLIWVQVVVPSKFLLAVPPLGASRHGLRRGLVDSFLGSIVCTFNGTLCLARRNSCNKKKGILVLLLTLGKSTRRGTGMPTSLAKLRQVINTEPSLRGQTRVRNRQGFREVKVEDGTESRRQCQTS